MYREGWWSWRSVERGGGVGEGWWRWRCIERSGGSGDV